MEKDDGFFFSSGIITNACTCISGKCVFWRGDNVFTAIVQIIHFTTCCKGKRVKEYFSMSVIAVREFLRLKEGVFAISSRYFQY